MTRTLAVSLLAVFAGVASAQVESIAQRFILSEPLIAPIAAIDFFARVDLSTITGVGSESAVVTAASIRILSRADESSPFVITNAGELLLPADPFADAPLAMRAEFLDGEFVDAVRIIDDPATSVIDFLQVENAAGFAGFFTVGGSDVIYGSDILNLLRYRLVSSSITPSPASAIILALGEAVGSRRRRAS
ncbi:MAG: hypothetical protein AAGJ54_13290 [Planctomycetota bacterium]